MHCLKSELSICEDEETMIADTRAGAHCTGGESEVSGGWWGYDRQHFPISPQSTWILPHRDNRDIHPFT